MNTIFYIMFFKIRKEYILIEFVKICVEMVVVIPSSQRADFESNYSTIGNPVEAMSNEATSESDRLLQDGGEGCCGVRASVAAVRGPPKGSLRGETRSAMNYIAGKKIYTNPNP